MMRPLQPGEVGVSFMSDAGQPGSPGEREILPESDLRLVDRTIQPGDFCKHTIDDVRSGVVTNVRVKGRIEHAISGEAVEGWKTLEELDATVGAEIGDYVVYDDWVGQVIELFDESLVEVSTGQLVRLPELSSRLTVGDKGTDILPPPSGGMYHLFGFLLGANRSGSIDTVIDIKHTVYAVAWLAVSQLLDPANAAQKTRPQKFWHGEDVAKLTVIRGRSDLEMRMGDRVRLKNSTGAPSTTHGQEGGETVQVQVFVVAETQTTLDILWQDGTQETIKSTEVIPYLNPDEYDCPVTMSFGKERISSDPQLSNLGAIELASVLELDPHGTDLAVIQQSASEGLGVRRGDFVFIHREGTTNGFEKPAVPKIGEVEPWVREGASLQGHLVGWRKAMGDLGTSIATRSSSEGPQETHRMSHPTPGSDAFAWIGEVTNLNLDGTVEVTHPDSAVKVYPLERLTKLYDGIEQLEDDLWGDETPEHLDEDMDGDEAVWSMDEDGVWQPNMDGDEWEEYEDEDMESEDEDPINVEAGGWADESMEDPIEEPEAPAPLPDKPATETLHQPPLDRPLDATETLVESGDELTWKRFEVLSSAPPDHAFFSSPPAETSKAFLGRLTKEYRVLSNSLPESIIVRAYEDRTDLLRCLILGPANTPYEDAPFMIDWMLDSNFPHSPPIAHFHSWTNGNGRVNPNLYEEGKVCLSILGTWSGDREEMWSAARSSLLQAFVSIQGLVLVKEPWFCEPAYDKLRGTEEGIVNSRLYNEKAYVLSRAFVRRALEIPLGGLEDEVKWLYYQNRRLEKVLRDARALVEKSLPSSSSDENLNDRDLAVPRLTAGGIITLERTLNRLQILHDSYRMS
ncbi:hypothetical protein DXG03_008940 [Asterophora parasitica]|uniref:UBC core domain-containing protein n=1 Tax=Asterophora parasitica TaxID=117018 RepID=A0A9P7GIA4_9AGAR|nr:hypothetical protein DXG03_008940 [Asterophora parasitica]